MCLTSDKTSSRRICISASFTLRLSSHQRQSVVQRTTRPKPGCSAYRPRTELSFPVLREAQKPSRSCADGDGIPQVGEPRYLPYSTLSFHGFRGVQSAGNKTVPLHVPSTYCSDGNICFACCEDTDVRVIRVMFALKVPSAAEPEILAHRTAPHCTPCAAGTEAVGIGTTNPGPLWCRRDA